MLSTRLFDPITVGSASLGHRVVHAPTSRNRSTRDNIITDLVLSYYTLRSCYPGTLIVFELTLVGTAGGLVPYKPGVFTAQQQAALRAVVELVHANKCFISVQLVSPGRLAHAALAKEHGLRVLAPSPIPWSEQHAQQLKDAGLQLEELTIEEIHTIQREYVDAAAACVACGADFVELHGTSGFLVEQFLSPLSNERTDKYGGSVENRARFLLELVDMYSEHPAIGAAKTGVRLLPWSVHHGMNYPRYDDISEHPLLQMCKYLFEQLEARRRQGNGLAYVSLMEPRVSGSGDLDECVGDNAPLLPLWTGPLIRSGAYATNYQGGPKATAQKVDTVHYEQLLHDVNADDRTLIGLSRPFTSNPDLVERLAKGTELTEYQRPYFYTYAKKGYLDFAAHGEEADTSEPERTGTPLAT